MPLGKCVNGHVYNASKHGDTCPICGSVSRKSKEEGKTPEEILEMYTIPHNRYACGLLVCVDGINKGKCYPIHPGKNFIGANDNMDIQILGDDQVDLYRHAVLVYDEKVNSTTLLSGESTGLVYLEGQAVYAPKTLKSRAHIELGASKFLFIPICDSTFQWH